MLKELVPQGPPARYRLLLTLTHLFFLTFEVAYWLCVSTVERFLPEGEMLDEPSALGGPSTRSSASRIDPHSTQTKVVEESSQNSSTEWSRCRFFHWKYCCWELERHVGKR